VVQINKVERVALWSVLGLLVVWLLVLTMMVVGELEAINAVLAEGISAGLQMPPDEAGDEGDGEQRTEGTNHVQASLAGVDVLSDTVVMTVAVRASGPGDLLYEPPELVDSDGDTYPVTSESLERARFAFLDLTTKGQATTRLAFSGTPAEGERLTLVFNPHQTAADAYLAPTVKVLVPSISRAREGE
jgi:hypothetical protein